MKTATVLREVPSSITVHCGTQNIVYGKSVRVKLALGAPLFLFFGEAISFAVFMLEV